MRLKRTLRLGSAGEDVMEVKMRLLALGCYAAHVTQVTTDVFGTDTQAAVRAFKPKTA